MLQKFENEQILNVLKVNKHNSRWRQDMDKIEGVVKYWRRKSCTGCYMIKAKKVINRKTLTVENAWGKSTFFFVLFFSLLKVRV